MVLLGAVASAKAANVARTEVLLPSDESSSGNISCVALTRYDYNPIIIKPPKPTADTGSYWCQ